MPRRRDPMKTREFSTVLRDAQISQHEIEGEKDARKQKDLIRARDSAFDEIVKIDRTKTFRGEKLGALEQLQANNVIQGLMARNGGQLPRPKGGRPRRSPRHLQLAVRVMEELENCKENESIDSALTEVAERLRADRDYITEIYYDYLHPDRDPELLKSVRAERAFSKENTEIGLRRAEIERLANLPRSECEQQLTAVAGAWGVDPLPLGRLVQRARNKRQFAASRLHQQQHGQK
jgi:hypothetical protein